MDDPGRSPTGGPPPAKDVVLWLGVAVWILSILPSVVPVLPPDVTFAYADQYSDVPPLAVALVLAILAARAASVAGERAFWHLITGAIVAWLGVRGVYLSVPEDAWGTGPDLATDLIYLAGYLLLAFALEARVFALPRRGAHQPLRVAEVFGTLFFAFGLLAYFVVIPSVFNPEVYASWVPSLLLYAVLDIYLLARVASLIGRPLPPGWRRPLIFLAATFALWGLTDVLEGLLYLEVLPWFDPGSPVDVLWHVPSLTLLLAIRSRSWSAPPSEERAAHLPDEVQVPTPRHGTALVAMAFALPAIHFLGVVFGTQSTATEVPRAYVLMAHLTIFAILLAIHERIHRRRSQELETENRAVEEQLQISQRMEAVGRLASGVAHDFSNLLSVVRGRAELLLMPGNLTPEGREDAGEIVDAARRGQALVGQLLTLGRKTVSEAETLDLVALVDDLLTLLSRVIPESVVIRVDHASAYAWVVANRSQLEQVILNLVVNARDAMPDGGTLTIHTEVVRLDDREATLRGGEAGGDYAVLTVRDTGSGVSPEMRSLVFEPFFTTKPAGEGTGLGLSIVYGIVRQAGGFIRVTDGEEGGAVFEVHFPLAAEAAPPAPVAEPEAPTGSQGTILLVEDDMGMRRTASRVLRHAGYAVIEAESGGEALAILERREPITLLLSDLVLPDISGFRLRDRAVARRPELKVLFMSGYPDGVTPLRVPETTPVLEKPFSPEVLLLSVRRALTDDPRTHEVG